MSILEILYQLLIGPLELFFEVVFTIANRVIDNPGLSIIFLSLAMNILVLPLYRQADKKQEEARERTQRMKPWTDHIKKTFSGDERFMILQTYNRQNGYKQTDALTGSISLLLEIPFFIAAFHFLSNLQVLKGTPFGPLTDLGAPDGLISFGDMTINALPILMTLINVISAAIYLRGFPLNTKIQTYGIAAIFLVLLYNSPSGLVFYWTLNNVFSLVKNLFYKMPNPKLVLGILLSLLGIALFAFAILHPLATTRRQIFLFVCVLLFQLPLIVYCLQSRNSASPTRFKLSTREPSRLIFLTGCIFLTVLTGLLIPSNIIAASPLEFVNVNEYVSPLWYLVSSLVLAAGTFLIWFNVFYGLASPNGQRILEVFIWIFAICAIVNYLFFGTTYGNLSPSLQYDDTPVIARPEMLYNAALMLVICVLGFFIWRKSEGLVKVVCIAASLSLVAMVGINVSTIQKELNSAGSAIKTAAAAGDARIPISKNGKNVVVIMLDRGASGFLPFIMNEKPEVESILDGFTFYPNTVSFGNSTNYGSPGLYGGYEYTPGGLNARPDVTLVDKQNEALKIMPYLFDDAGYRVTVCDPTYAGYGWIPDLGIYNERPSINAYITNGKYQVEGLEFESYAKQRIVTWKRNFFCFSLFKTAPLFIQPVLYADGTFNAGAKGTGSKEDSGSIAANSVGIDEFVQTRTDLSHGTGLDEAFMNSYAVLKNLANMTDIEDTDSNTFLMMSNDTPHEPALLQEPDYVPAVTVDNTAYDAAHPNRVSADGRELDMTREKVVVHYHSNVATYFALGEWFNYLRENGVYDNTRIILVSDHAWDFGTSEEMILSNVLPDSGKTLTQDLSNVNCLYLVKDFNATGFTVDNQFMTNADTPVLAFKDLIDSPTNPFTGKAIDTSGKENGPVTVVLAKGDAWKLNPPEDTVLAPGYSYSVHDNIFDSNNWEYLGVR